MENSEFLVSFALVSIGTAIFIYLFSKATLGFSFVISVFIVSTTGILILEISSENEDSPMLNCPNCGKKIWDSSDVSTTMLEDSHTVICPDCGADVPELIYDKENNILKFEEQT